ncbi:MAG: LytTR family DNA-binding domain-containing protein [Candidatus Pedobacter colombiensis]|uniref:LytTR family DNA-binding domain-containing protein n=1 Tax=Candidatus Pedobacter colombiensis TaxID=3121371 RepID=A0AAJ5W3H5_9SPHI|nr:LytTR family DNA-binding domain-containing protein [Pedobacter sp.]WEK17828.1 MAG: LytTR family DNA-binding domain-containing protein [Pedobacter sp.]
MKALLIDDEHSNNENLISLLRKYCPAIHVMAAATDLNMAFDLINIHQPDLLFLDIQMGSQTGFDLLKLVPMHRFEVIFVTAFDKYGITAIKFAALDYLLKPVNISELIQAVSKAEEKYRAKEKNKQLNFLLNHIQNGTKQPTKIALPQLHEIRYVTINEIVRCESDNSYTFFYLVNGDRILVSRSIKEYADLLKSIGFLRTHQSHLVNSIFVKSWIKEDGGVLLLSNGDRIPVSKPNKSMVQLALNSYLN